MASKVSRAHIQNFTDASGLEPHWGYADRVVPCTNDAGSCEYLDVVYGSHDVGMLYVGIFWATIGAILLIWAVGRHFSPTGSNYQAGLLRRDVESSNSTQRPFTSRLSTAIRSQVRRNLLPDCLVPVFGRTTRLQVSILGLLCAYLTIWTFAGITYKTWITPVKNMPGVYNTRTSLGPWSDRIGVLAYALTPLSILLSTRESLLSMLTGVPYQNFNFLHRWVGYIIVVQSSLHTIGWLVIEVRLYQPQPQVANDWIKQLYMIWGVVAFGLLMILYVLSLPIVIRRTGYEFFRKSHYVLAMVYIGACIAHWQNLQCFLIPSLVLWFIDRAARMVRTFLLHYDYKQGGGMGFSSTPAEVILFPDPVNGDIVRLDFEQAHDPWKIGQHFYICFTEGSIWQSHPFTPLNCPGTTNGLTKHSYIFRAKSGETKKIADVSAKKLAAITGGAKVATGDSKVTTPVILTGPYGESIMDELTPKRNILCVAGGTGITYALPVLLNIKNASGSRRRAELIWVVRRKQDVEWIRPELDELLTAAPLDLTVRIFVTRESSPSSSHDKETIQGSSSSSSASEKHGLSTVYVKNAEDAQSDPQHPDLGVLVKSFVDNNSQGPTTVFASGPGGMISDLRRVVADCNSGLQAWRGEERYDVSLQCDERLEM
jgi:predicted ferric reductase